jgi:hypothetical protein
MKLIRDKYISILLVFDIILMSVFILLSLLSHLVAVLIPAAFHTFYFGFFSWVFYYYFYIFTIECFIKLIVVAIIIVQRGIKTKLHFNNVFQLIISILQIYYFYYLYLLYKSSNYNFDKLYFTDAGIPSLIMAFGLLLFLIYFINRYKNKILKVMYIIVSPITSLLLIFEIWRLNKL